MNQEGSGKIQRNAELDTANTFDSGSCLEFPNTVKSLLLFQVPTRMVAPSRHLTGPEWSGYRI